MIKKVESSPWKKIAALAIVPAFGLFFWASTEPSYVVNTNGITGSDFLDATAVEENALSYENETAQRSGDKAVWVHTALGKGVLTAIFEKYPQAMVLLDDKKSSKDEIMTQRKNLQTLIEYNSLAAVVKYGDEGKNGVLLGTTYKPLKTILYQPNQLSGEQYKVDTKKELVFVDGHELKTGRLVSLNDDKIKHVYLTEVPRNREVLSKKYGNKIKGKSRVVEIITKDPQSTSNQGFEIRGVETTTNEKNSLTHPDVLIILDGKEIPYAEFQNINSNTIESVDVLKDASHTAIYGDKGKNGVILIISKKGDAI